MTLDSGSVLCGYLVYCLLQKIYRQPLKIRLSTRPKFLAEAQGESMSLDDNGCPESMSLGDKKFWSLGQSVICLVLNTKIYIAKRLRYDGTVSNQSIAKLI